MRASCVVCLYMSLCLSVCLFFRSFLSRFISNQINQHTSDEENHTFKTTDPHMFNRGPIWGLEISARGSAWYDLIRYEWNGEWNWIEMRPQLLILCLHSLTIDSHYLTNIHSLSLYITVFSVMTSVVSSSATLQRSPTRAFLGPRI